MLFSCFLRPSQDLPFLNRKVHLIQTQNEKTLKKVLDKTLLVTERRLLECQITSLIEKRCAHNVNNLSEKINESVKENADIILVFGASAICDKNDIVPLSLKKNNGKIIRLGMPVEPGNLMLLGKTDHNNKIIFVLGMPGCARSQKENGVDWILWRLLCGLEHLGIRVASQPRSCPMRAGRKACTRSSLLRMSSA